MKPRIDIGALGKVWSPQGFSEYVSTLHKPKWVQGITLHHTAAPSLATRPQGLAQEHMRNLAQFYTDKGWSAAPHLFVDDIHISGLTPITFPGIHARSFNATHIGIEVLGDYDRETPTKGRGFLAWLHTAQACHAFITHWGISPSNINFHRDDPKTPKTCPGKLVTKAWFLDLLADAEDFMDPPDLEATLSTHLVPVADYLARSGSPAKLTRLTRRNGQTYLGPWRLETAYYDKERKATLATQHELNQWASTQ